MPPLHCCRSPSTVLLLLLYHPLRSPTVLTMAAGQQCYNPAHTAHLQPLIMQPKAHFQAQVGQLSRQVLQASSIHAHKARPMPNKAQLTMSQPRQLLQLGQDRANTTCKMQSQ